jgi:hypothetical protein
VRPLSIERTERNGQVRWRNGPVTAIRDKTGIELIYRRTKTQAVTWREMKPEHTEILAEVARAAAVNAGGSRLAGQSLIEGLWKKMDEIVAPIFEGDYTDEDKARAEVMTWVLAYFTNPYKIDTRAIKFAAKERWERAQ